MVENNYCFTIWRVYSYTAKQIKRLKCKCNFEIFLQYFQNLETCEKICIAGIGYCISEQSHLEPLYKLSIRQIKGNIVKITVFLIWYFMVCMFSSKVILIFIFISFYIFFLFACHASTSKYFTLWCVFVCKIWWKCDG